jgi:hypothetical protein
LKQAKRGEEDENINHLLQELAWQAVTDHPLSGVLNTRDQADPRIRPDSVSDQRTLAGEMILR